MKKIRKWIIALTIFIIIVIIFLVILYIKKELTSTDNYDNSKLEHDVSNMSLNLEIKKVDNRNNFYAIKSIIRKYAYTFVDEGTESLLKMLNPEIISANNINSKNVFDKTENISKEELTEEQINNLEIETNIQKMYYKDIDSSIATYFVYGEFKYNIESNKMPFSIIVEIDSNQNTFYIYPSKYVEKSYPNEKALEQYTSKTAKEIPQNDYNAFDFVNIEDITIINDYLLDYKNKVIENAEESYEKIEETYRKEKFSNKKDYQKYLKDNIKDLMAISVEKYQVDYKEDYTQYTCLDKKGNTYILKETAIMEYTLLLDTYTVDMPEFIDKYEKAKPQKKVGMNTEKIIKALNQKDYRYLYSKLDKQFKENNFATQEAFEKYMKNKYPDTYDVKYENATEKNGIYVQPITLTAQIGENDTKIENNVVMQLGEGTDFVMSFDIK